MGNYTYQYDNNGNQIFKGRVNPGKTAGGGRGPGAGPGDGTGDNSGDPGPYAGGGRGPGATNGTGASASSVSANSQTPNLAMANNGHHYGWDKNKGNGNGNHTGDIPGVIQGEYFWNEENRLIEAVSNGRRSYYLYNASGERTVKWGEGETLYVSQYYQLQNQTQVTKHIFVGTTRIVSKLSHYHDPALSYELAGVTMISSLYMGLSSF